MLPYKDLVKKIDPEVLLMLNKVHYIKVHYIAIIIPLLLVFTSDANSQDSYPTYNQVLNKTDHNYLILTEIEPPVLTAFQAELDEITNKLSQKRNKYKNEIDFLRYAYYKVHRKYLDHYKSPSTLQKLFQKGYYDCLTGTALYAIIFEDLGLDYEIVETTYHVYLTVNTGNHQVLIECTSPLEGFITDPALIRKAVDCYKNDCDNGVWSGQNHNKLEQPVHNKVNLNQLAGLQYFNLAVESYNRRNLKAAIFQLVRALELYPSDRLKAMMVLMLETLTEDDAIDPLVKQEVLSKFDHLRSILITAHTNK